MWLRKYPLIKEIDSIIQIQLSKGLNSKAFRQLSLFIVLEYKLINWFLSNLREREIERERESERKRFLEGERQTERNKQCMRLILLHVKLKF